MEKQQDLIHAEISRPDKKSCLRIAIRELENAYAGVNGITRFEREYLNAKLEEIDEAFRTRTFVSDKLS